MGKIKKLAVLTSGGDSPGMNAAIRAVVRASISHNIKPFGVYQGYKGLIEDNIKELKTTDVSNIIQRGGTILKSARCMEFHKKNYRKKAYENLKKRGIDALIVIGGDGTFAGARLFSDEFDIPTVGIPGTIDNDLFGTDMTIGFDTALNTVMEAVDKIRDTASSHDRLFFVEVMGRDAGFIALRSAIACGAEAVLVPEVPTLLEDLRKNLEGNYKRKKTSNIIIVAEGEREGGAVALAEKMQKEFPDYSMRVAILGHIQRGGSPSIYDRYLASRLGVGAVEALIEGQKSVMIGYVDKQVVHVTFSKTIKHHKDINRKLLEIVNILNT